MVLRESLFLIKVGKQKNKSHSRRKKKKIMQETKSNHYFPSFSAMSSSYRIIII